MLLILLIIEYVCTSASALALHTCLFFLCSVHVEQSHVCVCVLRSLASPSHLSLLCIRCMWECASGKSPHYFNAAYFPAPHSGLFLSLLWHETEENPQCVCACARVCAHTPSHLVTSDAAVGSLHCQENPRLAGMLNAYAHTHTTLRTRKCFYTRELHICRRTQAHTLLPFHTLALNLFHYFTASSITVAMKPTWPLLTPM